MSDVIDTSESGYDTIDEDSILYTIQGVAERFGRAGSTKKYFSRRMEKFLLPIGVAVVILVFWGQSLPVEQVPILGMSVRLLATLIGIMFSIFILVFIFGSTFFLKTKAGGSKGALKFNTISQYTGARMNEMENDMLIKSHRVLNRNLDQFSIFQDILDSKGKITIDINKDDTLQEEDYHLDDIRSDSVIAEILSEVEEKPEPEPAAMGTSPPLPTRRDHNFGNAPFDEALSGSDAQELQKDEYDQTVLMQSTKEYSQYDVKKDERVIAEITPMSKFFKDLDRFYIHIIDFTDNYEFNGMKQKGLIFIYPEEDLSKILPRSDVPIFMTVGFTFGSIPSYHTDFIPIAFKGKVPIYYPLMTKERNLKLGNLGYFHETIPSRQAIVSAKNLIELVVAKPLKFILNDLLVQVKSYTEGMEKITRKGMGYADRTLNQHKIMHQPDSAVNHWWWALGGFMGAVITYQWWIGIVQAVANWLGV